MTWKVAIHMGNNIPLKAIQTCEFEILKYIRELCEQNDLRYYLCYGTLIGAVRHQGFIPWDDDMDIHMPRRDYLRFVRILQENPHPYYRLISGETSPMFTQILPKVIDTRTKLTQIAKWRDGVQLGVYVDIFVLDGAGNTVEEAEKTYNKAYSIYSQWKKSVQTMFYPGENKVISLMKWIHNSPERAKGFRYWRGQHNVFCCQKAYDDCEYVSALAAGTPQASRNVWRREWFGDGTDVLFNGVTFRAPANWDAVLRPEYGGYMELPPPYKRVSYHNYSLEIPEAVLSEFTEANENAAD